MEHYQEAPSQILRAIRACVTQEGEWTTDLPWMSQPALTASDRGISNRLTGRKVAKASRLWVGHKKMGVISLYFALGVIRTFLGHAPSPGKRRGLRECREQLLTQDAIRGSGTARHLGPTPRARLKFGRVHVCRTQTARNRRVRDARRSGTYWNRAVERRFRAQSAGCSF